jgi:hypothetical protein
MTFKHFTAALWSFNHRRKFKPFLIELVSGDRIHVTHPEAVILRNELWVNTSPENHYHVFENESVIRLLDVQGPPPT